jgi:hypothetical protein
VSLALRQVQELKALLMDLRLAIAKAELQRHVEEKP